MATSDGVRIARAEPPAPSVRGSGGMAAGGSDMAADMPRPRYIAEGRRGLADWLTLPSDPEDDGWYQGTTGLEAPRPRGRLALGAVTGAGLAAIALLAVAMFARQEPAPDPVLQLAGNAATGAVGAAPAGAGPATAASAVAEGPAGSPDTGTAEYLLNLFRSRLDGAALEHLDLPAEARRALAHGLAVPGARLAPRGNPSTRSAAARRSPKPSIIGCSARSRRSPRSLTRLAGSRPRPSIARARRVRSPPLPRGSTDP